MKFPRQPVEPVDVNLTPLIDVVFLLLIFFLVATKLAQEERELDIPLPEAAEARHPARNRWSRIRQAMRRDPLLRRSRSWGEKDAWNLPG